MLPDRVSNPGPLTYESGALPIAKKLRRQGTRHRGYKIFSCSAKLSMKCFLLINVKMPTIVGILTFISRKKTFSAYMLLKNAEFLEIFILMCI